jgi:hypothetical protein
MLGFTFNIVMRMLFMPFPVFSLLCIFELCRLHESFQLAVLRVGFTSVDLHLALVKIGTKVSPLPTALLCSVSSLANSSIPAILSETTSA